jgi:endonuclease YncB( thermonuclease family)
VRGLILALLAAAVAGWVVAARGAPCWRGWVVALVEVVDGDTVELDVTWEPEHIATVRVRILGIDTPELRPRRDVTAREEIKAAALAAKAYTVRWLETAGPTELLVCRPARDSLGRLLGRLVSVTQGDLSAALITAGHAVPYRP